MERKPGAVVIKSVTDDAVILAGHGVIFGGRDLEGDFFTPETDFMLDLVPRKLITFNHTQDISKSLPPQMRDVARGMPVIKDAIGFLENENIDYDKVGLWIEATINTSKEYMQYVTEMLERGLLGWSSSTAGAFMDVDPTGKVLRWPIIEFGLTPIPAEPRTLGVSQIKALFNDAGLEVPEAFNEARKGERGTGESGETGRSARAQRNARIFLVGG